MSNNWGKQLLKGDAIQFINLYGAQLEQLRLQLCCQGWCFRLNQRHATCCTTLLSSIALLYSCAKQHMLKMQCILANGGTEGLC
jgi:hypothetical protein